MPTLSTDRAAPHNLEAERALLGSILLDNEALTEACKTIGRFDFFSEAHRLTFGKMLELHDSRRVIDLVTLSEELSKDGLLEKAGGAAYLSGLTDGVPIGTTDGLLEYCRIVKDKAKKRRAINAANNIIARALEGTDSAEDILEIANEQIQDIRLQDGKVLDSKTGIIEVDFKIEPERKGKPKKQENIYPVVPKDGWHPAAEIYRKAHERCTEGSDNWHFITFYTVCGSMFGRTLGTRMGGIIYGNLYSVLVGQIGGDGKDTTADFGTDFVQMVDPALYIPEAIDSKAGFVKEWMEYNSRREIMANHRALLRLPEIRSYLDAAEQSGTKSIAPMLLTHYSPRPSLDNSSVATNAHVVKPHLSMLACGAKRFIGNIPEPDLINGLGRRVCFVPGDPKGPNDDPDPPDMEALVPLAARVKEAMEFYRSRKDALLRFSPEAKKLWKDWYKIYWRRKRGDDLLAALNNGDRVTCRKLALINAGLDMEEEFIKPQHLDPAMSFVEFLYKCRYPIFSEHGANPYVEIEKKILDKIPEYPNRVLKRWVQRNCRAIDSKTFNDRIKYMTMDDGPLTRKQEGKKIWLWRSE
jgi:hypothetical protein